MADIRTYRCKGFWLLSEMILTGTVDLSLFMTRWSIHRSYGKAERMGMSEVVHSKPASLLGLKYRKYYLPPKEIIENMNERLVSCSWVTASGRLQTLEGKVEDVKPQMDKLKRMYPSTYETLTIVEL